MKILLSAYACEPNKGSEPGVGWNWAIELSKLGYDVWVLTRANNREPIENELTKSSSIKNLHFIYYDLPVWAKFLKKLPGGIYPYYMIWQLGAFKIAQSAHTKENFSIVHHLTFGVIRMPSFMGYLKIPFFIGPIGGGETAPNSIRNGYPLHGKILDFMRDCLNIWSKFDPLMYITFKRAAIIFLKTPDSKKNIPLKFHDKIKVQVEIGTALNIHAVQNLSDSKRNPLRILFVGRFIYWKGMHLGLAAFSQLLKKIPEATLTIVGKGPDEKIWKDQTRSKKIEYAIQWIPWVTQEQLKSIYQSHDIFLFPSLHDSSGNVLLEAMTNGLPVICLDLGGPGVIVNESCGIKVSVRSKSQNTVINQLAKAMEKIISDRALYEQLRDGALMHAMNHTWSNAVQNTYSTISGNL